MWRYIHVFSGKIRGCQMDQFFWLNTISMEWYLTQYFVSSKTSRKHITYCNYWHNLYYLLDCYIGSRVLLKSSHIQIPKIILSSRQKLVWNQVQTVFWANYRHRHLLFISRYTIPFFSSVATRVILLVACRYLLKNQHYGGRHEPKS